MEQWNNIIVAIVVFARSLVPSSREAQKINSPTSYLVLPAVASSLGGARSQTAGS
jgi:hypothetical protein